MPFALTQTHTASPFAEASGVDPGLIPPYAPDHLDVRATLPLDVPADVAAREQVFAHESHLDELAAKTGIDPVDLRLQWLDDDKGSQLIGRMAAQSGGNGPLGNRASAEPGVRCGRGFAYSSVIDVEDGRPAHTWSAWVADVEVDSRTGDISVTRVTVGHEREEAATGDRPTTLLDDVAAATRQLTASGPRYDDWGDADTGEPVDASHALATHDPAHALAQLPCVEIIGALAGGTAAMLPAAAAVANAIHDATGVRLHEPPFSAGQIRQALEDQPSPRTTPRPRRWLLAALAPLAAFSGMCATVTPWRAIAPTTAPGPGFCSAATIERGRLVAAAGDCAVCHTAPNGARNTGGLALETPFGTVYSTNITPDADTGIGN